MSVEPSATAVVERYVQAMRVGAAAETEMMALFTEDAVYVEPFSGQPRTHVGREAIRATMREGWRTPLPDMRLTIERIDLDGGQVRCAWLCRSPALPAPVHGQDLYTLRDGQIARLETSLRRPS